MKKLFTVLAVLLVASVAFAAFSGSVEAGYTFDFDARDIDYVSAKKVDGAGANYDVTFVWDSQNLTIGEADGTHVEVAAHAGFEGFYLFNQDHAAGYNPLTKGQGEWVYVFKTEKTEDFKAGVKVKLNTFKIVGSNWEVSFISDLGLDFAKSAIDSKKFNKYKVEENVQNYSMDNSLKGAQNLVATVAGYKFGFGINTDDDWTEEVSFALTGVTPEYDFSGVKAQFGAGYQIYADQKEKKDYKTYAFAASAKVSYATDKLAVSGAYDAKITENKANENFVWNDLAVKVDVAPVTFDVFFANEDATAKDKYYNYFDYDHAATYGYEDADAMKAAHVDTLVSNYLSAQVVADIARVAENVPVKVTLSGSDLINEDSQVVSVEAETTIVPNFKFGVYFDDWFARDVKDSARKLGATVEFTGIEKITLNGEVAYRFADADHDTDKKLFILAGASYAHDLFTASASVAAEKNYKSDMVLGAKASVVSTTLVKGAELSAKAYFNLNDLEGLDDSNNATNKLALACKVSF